MTDFEEYTTAAEPSYRERVDNWQMAIGLQAVDGLTASPYLLETARRNIEGDLTAEEAACRIVDYYENRELRTEKEKNEHEADMVSVRLSKLLSEDAFSYSPVGIQSIHRRLFEGIFSFAGQFRTCNISKREWVLAGETVTYAPWMDLEATIEYDLRREEKFPYHQVTIQEMIPHFARFVAGLWQIHPFREGNTRTISAFAILYLRWLGYPAVSKEPFANHSWYFRNALVRANYHNVTQGIHPDFSFLEKFFRALLLDETCTFRNRELHVHADPASPPTETDGGGDTNLSSVEKKIKKYILKDAHTTAAQLAKKLGCSRRHTERLLASLKTKGILTRSGSRKTGTWQVTSTQ